MTILGICQKDVIDLTDEEFDKVFNEGFCDPTSKVIDASDSNPATHTAIIVYYPILMLTGIVLNCLVILTISSRPRLRTVPNAFMISLSIADFLMASVVVPLRLSELLKSTKSEYVISDMLFPLIGVASIFSLCSVTLDRYIHIRNALNYNKHMNKGRAIVLVTSIWLFSIFQALLVFFVVDHAKETIFNDVRLALCFALPALFIVAAYTKLFLIARAHARVIATTTPSFALNGQSTHKKDIRILKVVALIVGTFVVCWFPFFVLISYELHYHVYENSSSFRALMNISECLACSTCVFNPLLYGFLRRDFRLSIRNVAACRNESVDEATGTQ